VNVDLPSLAKTANFRLVVFGLSATSHSNQLK
jgi:hypothetical protein